MGWNDKKPTTHTTEGPPLLMTMHSYTPHPELDRYTCRCQLPRHNRHHHNTDTAVQQHNNTTTPPPNPPLPF